MLALSFPKFGHPAIGWIALAPLMLALVDRKSRIPNPKSLPPLREAFFLGLLTGVIYFTGTLYWITRVMVVYGGLASWVAVIVNAALIAYLALFPALFAVATRRLAIAHGIRALVAAPIVWVATELGRTYVLTGFPWVLLGYSQASVVPIAQLASVFGVYGVSLLVATVSAALATIGADPKAGRTFLPLSVAAIIAATVWGSQRVSRAELTLTGDPIRVGLIQGNVDQAIKWDPSRAATIFDRYISLTRQAIGEGAGLVLWPESSTPFMFEEEPGGAARIRALAQQARVPILFGSDQVVWRSENGRRVADRMYNSAFLVRADGGTAGVYRKVHLVPFGEYVPLRNLLFFAAPLVEAIGSGFVSGEQATVLPVDGHSLSVSICYEVVYPDLVRGFVRSGSELLTTITNDAWFGATSAPHQHFEQASMRAIEEGRYLVRAANTGVSGIVDPYGRVLAKTGIYEERVVVGDARFLRASTFYARNGDILAYACVVVTVVLLALSRRRIQ
ncbi:MAG TPA: apolipoprotein N-acyltransferase [Vicinamibacterales bacterium]|nr:apolipoprotein N-acyltransferase [Vicinamibacterales bacterium]